MRKKIVAGNWKMNKSLDEAIELAAEIVEGLKNKPAQCEVIIAPPFPFLHQVAQIISKSQGVHSSAQNCSSEKSGAYTGEVSANMIASVGARYIIIGHSERRSYFKEDPTLLSQKVLRCLEAGLTPIFCIGETLQERNEGNYARVLKDQLDGSLSGLSSAEMAGIVLAYEPVWAIGTGVTATTGQAGEAHQIIREHIQEKFGKDISSHLSILYGGSCNSTNASELFAHPEIDGGLIGGASLKSPDFLKIISSICHN